MKKLVALMLVLLLCLALCASLAEEAIPEITWDFPVPLCEIKSEYAILVNEENPLDQSYTPSHLVKVANIKRATSASVQLQETAADALKKMFESALLVTEYTYTNEKGKQKVAEYGSGGMVLYLKSGYRSYGTQSTTYANYLARNNNVDDGYVAKPGASEHQTGICADILNEDYAGRSRMTQDFKYTPEAQWMKENCAGFGFILRFTEEGEAETGIKFEPWHFRYVGEPIAQYIMENGMTLEDFTREAQAAYDDFISRGGDEQAWLRYEQKRINTPLSYVLDEYDEAGDAEVSLAY